MCAELCDPDTFWLKTFSTMGFSEAAPLKTESGKAVSDFGLPAPIIVNLFG
jgi:hypothetical protein